MGRVPDKDEMPRDPDLGDEEKDAPVPDQHDPHLGAAQSTSGKESMGSPYSWAPSWRPCWGTKAARRREYTWLTQPMDQDIYSEWDIPVQTLQQQFEDPFEEQKARARLRQIRKGSQSIKVARWAMVTMELTSLAGWYMQAVEAEVRLHRVQLLKQQGNPPLASPRPPSESTSPAHGGKEAGESLSARRRQLGLCLSCGREGHKAAVCPTKKPDPPVVHASGAAKAGTAKGPERKSSFKKGSGLQVGPHKASSASEEASGPESSEELVGNDSDLA
uniref:Uncharacterized protein n=1 Tax=Sphaerodactylus townsendi TaxID=933632 RepID=A0ACB8EC37_9SAUR